MRHLRRTHPQARVIGFDGAFFALSTTGATVLPERFLDEQHFGGIREIPASLLVALTPLSTSQLYQTTPRVTTSSASPQM
jgi:hypothetical protein